MHTHTYLPIDTCIYIISKCSLILLTAPTPINSDGARAPPFVLINFVLMAACVLSYDSNIYLVCTASMDLRLHQRSKHMRGTLLPLIKTLLYQAVLFGAGELSNTGATHHA
jgi:hypothetical protein